MQLHWLLPSVNGIPVLMYHRVWHGLRDGLTLTPEDLLEQWTYLRDEGYECLPLHRFLAIAKGREPAPRKGFMLTFDDGYRNNLDYVLPLLQDFGWEATVFIIGGTVAGSYDLQRDDAPAQKMDVAELKQLTGPNIKLGLHGFHHENFSEHRIEDIQRAVQQSCAAFEEAGIPYEKVLAYPYGARPKIAADFNRLKSWMSDFGIEAAFRIGNKPQRVPAPDMFELKRIDIRGGDTLRDFKIKLRKGKLKPF